MAIVRSTEKGSKMKDGVRGSEKGREMLDDRDEHQ